MSNPVNKRETSPTPFFSLCNDISPQVRINPVNMQDIFTAKSPDADKLALAKKQCIEEAVSYQSPSLVRHNACTDILEHLSLPSSRLHMACATTQKASFSHTSTPTCPSSPNLRRRTHVARSSLNDAPYQLSINPSSIRDAIRSGNGNSTEDFATKRACVDGNSLDRPSHEILLQHQNACSDILGHLGLSPNNTETHTCTKTESAAKKALNLPRPSIASMPPSSYFNSPISRCPPSPMPRRTHVDLSPFVSTALSIINSGSLNKEGRIFSLFKIPGMKGDHSQVYSVEGESALCTQASNKKIFIKIFLKELMESEGRRVETEFLKNSLNQYDELQRSSLVTVKIYNRQTVHQDGYLIVERLNPFMLPWNQATDRRILSEHQIAILQQMKSFVSYAMQSPSSVPLDLQAANFGLNAEGQLTLLDFMERDEDMPYAFHMIAKKCLLSLSNGNKEIYEELRLLARSESEELYQNLELL